MSGLKNASVKKIAEILHETVLGKPVSADVPEGTLNVDMSVTLVNQLAARLRELDDEYSGYLGRLEFKNSQLQDRIRELASERDSHRLGNLCTSSEVRRPKGVDLENLRRERDSAVAQSNATAIYNRRLRHRIDQLSQDNKDFRGRNKVLAGQVKDLREQAKEKDSKIETLGEILLPRSYGDWLPNTEGCKATDNNLHRAVYVLRDLRDSDEIKEFERHAFNAVIDDIHRTIGRRELGQETYKPKDEATGYFSDIKPGDQLLIKRGKGASWRDVLELDHVRKLVKVQGCTGTYWAPDTDIIGWRRS